MVYHDEASIIHDLHSMYDAAKSRDINFYPEKYKWVLGKLVLYNIEVAYNIIIKRDGPSTLFEIPVALDSYDPYNIQLWKNITSEV